MSRLIQRIGSMIICLSAVKTALSVFWYEIGDQGEVF